MTRVDVTARVGSEGTVSISGARGALLRFASLLAKGESTVVALLAPATVAPYASAATTMRIRVDPDPGVALSWERDELVVTGEPSALAMLARNISTFGSEPTAAGGHVHEDYFPGHSYLRQGSSPTVIELTGR